MIAVKAAGQLWARWDPEQFGNPLTSCEKLAEDNLEKLIEQHLQEVCDGFPIVHVNGVEEFFKEYLPGKDEVFSRGMGASSSHRGTPDR